MPQRKARQLERKCHMTATPKACAAPGCATKLIRRPCETQPEYDDRNFCDASECQSFARGMAQVKINSRWDERMTGDPVVYSNSTLDGRAKITELLQSGAISPPTGYRVDTNLGVLVKM